MTDEEYKDLCERTRKENLVIENWKETYIIPELKKLEEEINKMIVSFRNKNRCGVHVEFPKDQVLRQLKYVKLSPYFFHDMHIRKV